eukprot:10232317-Prorocentrum_lima.AAC.1
MSWSRCLSTCSCTQLRFSVFSPNTGARLQSVQRRLPWCVKKSPEQHTWEEVLSAHAVSYTHLRAHETRRHL